MFPHPSWGPGRSRKSSVSAHPWMEGYNRLVFECLVFLPRTSGSRVKEIRWQWVACGWGKRHMNAVTNLREWAGMKIIYILLKRIIWGQQSELWNTRTEGEVAKTGRNWNWPHRRRAECSQWESLRTHANTQQETLLSTCSHAQRGWATTAQSWGPTTHSSSPTFTAPLPTPTLEGSIAETCTVKSEKVSIPLFVFLQRKNSLLSPGSIRKTIPIWSDYYIGLHVSSSGLRWWFVLQEFITLFTILGKNRKVFFYTFFWQ